LSFSYSLRSPYKVKIAAPQPKLVPCVLAKQPRPGYAGSTRNRRHPKRKRLKPSNVPGLQKLVPSAGIGLKINFVTFTTNNMKTLILIFVGLFFLTRTAYFPLGLVLCIICFVVAAYVARKEFEDTPD
jgi:hypothetical protein